MRQFHCGIELPNFLPNEFCCPCCGDERLQKNTLLKIQHLRDILSMPISIVEGGGWRCAQFDPNEHSAHRSGYAADLAISNIHYYQVVSNAILLGFTGIGIKNRNGKYQLHLDNAVNLPGIRPRPWIWTYDT